MNEHHNTPWISIILAVLAIIAFIACSPRQGGGVIEMMTGSYGVQNGAPVPSAAGRPMMDNAATQSSMPMPYYGGGEVPVTDTREFLKKDYYAMMRTRDVIGLTQRVETTVRGYDGRIDQSSSSERDGYVQFVVPLSKFDDFRHELEAMVGSRFISIQISSQNLLPQKQDIEASQKQVEQNIADLQAARAKLVANHSSAVASLQSQINTDQAQWDALNAQPYPTPAQQAQMSSLATDIANLKVRFASENSSYANQRDSYDSQIKYANTSLTAVKTQDQTLLDTVATVRGTINIQWISLWDIARLYLPGYSIPAILALLSVLSYFWERRLWVFKR